MLQLRQHKHLQLSAALLFHYTSIRISYTIIHYAISWKSDMNEWIKKNSDINLPNWSFFSLLISCLYLSNNKEVQQQKYQAIKTDRQGV